ncbi:c-type cytochrome [Pacificoceanicola onchidii]|uniref:c-type cytochrome n=1 Tax=Pacificoceanicola onchidii TaxID=2562685 RepID=UPI0010A695D6|nr:hypothetical protein [Pacificoceanicola onchidii]
MQSLSAKLRQICGGTVAVMMSVGAPTAVLSQEFGNTGEEIYEETCNKCHGLISQESSWYDFAPEDGSDVQLAVILARGPTLNGIVNRPVGIIKGYKYSKAMKAFAETGAVWDRETLDRYITDSRAMVKGYMVLKLGEADRKLVLDYLTSVALYQP